jgi:hypothetical protein
MFNINFSQLIKDFLPDVLARQPKRMDFIKAMVVAGVEKLYLTNCLPFFSETFYTLSITGQVIYLEKLLNDKYDNINRGIYIDSNLLPRKFYLYQKNETVPPVYIYRKFDINKTYLTNDYCVFSDNKVYKALTNNSGNIPTVNSNDWLYIKEVDYLRTKLDFNSSINFIIYIPTAVVFDSNQLKKLVNFYKIAGKTYLIKLY